MHRAHPPQPSAIVSRHFILRSLIHIAISRNNCGRASRWSPTTKPRSVNRRPTTSSKLSGPGTPRSRCIARSSRKQRFARTLAYCQSLLEHERRPRCRSRRRCRRGMRGDGRRQVLVPVHERWPSLPRAHPRGLLVGEQLQDRVSRVTYSVRFVKVLMECFSVLAFSRIHSSIWCR